MPERPSVTVTFLFSDIEGSTKRWDRFPTLMGAAVARHDDLVRAAIESHGGYVFKTVGDAFCAAFTTAPDALAAAIDAQFALEAEPWGEVGAIRIRIALHVGIAEERDGDYFGPPLNRVARLMSGAGGQVLMSLPAAELVRDSLPEGAALRDMGLHRLKDLQRPEHVFQLVMAGLRSDFPPIKTLDSQPNNLPLQPTPLVGRESEVAGARELLLRPDVRLVTITGPGGIGKTRLALQAAADSLDDFPDGVFFVPLATTAEPELIPAAIAQVLGIRESSGLEALQDFLRERTLLLVLDNLEQVIGAGPVITRLLAPCPRVKGLVTSRESLRVYGERELPLGPLALPDRRSLPPLEHLTQYEAVRLFIERAQAVKPDFMVTNENAPAVAEICQKLDGLPLAIELAAARLRLFPPQALLGRLEHRLAVLTGGSRDLPARQQTLRGAISWSHDLLDEGERQLFRRLGVFAGGLSLEAAETICGAVGDLQISVLDGVESLVTKSLLRQHEVEGGEPRFAMLETIREYALEQLAASGERDDVARKHAEYYSGLVRMAEPELRGPLQAEWLERLDREHDNLRATLRWAPDHGAGDFELQFAARLWFFWYTRGYLAEGQHWLEAALAHDTQEPGAVRTRVLTTTGLLSWSRGDLGRAAELLEEAVALARTLGDQRGIWYALSGLGTVRNVQGDHDAARALYQECLEIQRQLGDRCNIARTLNNLGIVASSQGDHASARALYEESLGVQRAIDDRWGEARSLANLGELARLQGDFESAESYYSQSLSLKRELGDVSGVAQTTAEMALLARDRDDTEHAWSLAVQALQSLREQGGVLHVAVCFEVLASVALTRGDARNAARLLGAADAVRDRSGAPLPQAEWPRSNDELAAARAALGDEEFATTFATGQSLSPDIAILEALSMRAR